VEVLKTALKYGQKLLEAGAAVERKPFYEFGAFRIDPGKRLLLRDGHPVPLTAKVFDTLLVLVENRGRVVEKDELMRLVWLGTVVEESNLSQNVFTLRKVLGEMPHDHRYIATIPRRGYQFVAEVRQTPPTAGAALAGPASSAPPARSLAVLPFISLGPPDTDDYLGLGMADALITRLGNLRRILVRPTSAVRAYVGQTPDPVTAGRSLGVDMVLEGAIQRAGERIRVTVQLVSVGAGAPVWGERFDERLTDIFAVQDSISLRLAAALVLTLSAEERVRIERRYTDDHEAHDAYLRGRHHWNTRTDEGLRKAIGHFEQAIARDPRYALAHAGLADCYTLLGSAGYGALPPKEALSRARAAAVEALAVDPELAEAHTSLALVKFRLDWDWAGAEAEFRRAIQLNPGYASAHHFYGLYLSAMGRSAEAIASLRMAQELDPLSLIIGAALGRAHHFARQPQEAREQYRKTLEIDPDFAEARMNLGLLHAHQSRYDEAGEELQCAMVVAGRRPLLQSILAYIHGLSGQTERAQGTLDELARLAEQGRVPVLFLVYPLIGLGEMERAFELLEKAQDERSGLLVFLKVEPIFDPLRSDARLDALLRRMGLGGDP
jgi:DNA-binding winged helix-turn-helix (wHTH) protein/tetratricopeptide (TPR) repeat protein